MQPTDTESKALPILIYDGDCGFCKYWVDYWQKLTGSTVSYQPYQKVEQDYPSISREEFQRAVQYIAPNGKIASAAEASFLTLSHAKGQSIWLWFYKKLPGFAFISEKAYSIISAHRKFFYRICLFLWGREHEPPQYNIVAWLFLRIFGMICLCAFISFWVQALGLIGNQGIIPVSELVTAANQQLGSERYTLLPMVFWVNTSDLVIQITCLGGVLFSCLLILNILPRLSLLIIYILYLSLCSAGQLFMSFQWDNYLLETAIIAFFLLCYQTLGIWLFRWLLFRFMLGGGLVKVLSDDITWRNLSALSYYFTTEPLPTPLAWYAAHLPSALLKFGTLSTLIIELVIPFLIFFPRRLRFISAYFILLFQILILITGNYNFFNLLTILLCLILFDDAAIKTIISQDGFSFLLKRIHSHSPNNLTAFFTYSFLIFTVLISLFQFNWLLGGPTLNPLPQIEKSLQPFRFVNTYGPFAVMTTRRMEICIEGSYDGIHWLEYEFKYKAGDLYRRPPWNIPHQPRLDWQMWFAALGTVDDNPWFLRLLERMLENSPTVLGLLKNNPFPERPPLYLRAQFYEYQFSNPTEKQTTGAWWQREWVGLYVREVHLKSQQ